jgi:hypothetical protein
VWVATAIHHLRWLLVPAYVGMSPGGFSGTINQARGLHPKSLLEGGHRGYLCMAQFPRLAWPFMGDPHDAAGRQSRAGLALGGPADGGPMGSVRHGMIMLAAVLIASHRNSTIASDHNNARALAVRDWLVSHGWDDLILRYSSHRWSRSSRAMASPSNLNWPLQGCYILPLRLSGLLHHIVFLRSMLLLEPSFVLRIGSLSCRRARDDVRIVLAHSAGNEHKVLP